MTNAKPWFCTADMAPPAGVRVDVLWDGRRFEAARVKNPDGPGVKWLTHDKRQAVFLPLDTRVRRAPPDPLRPWAGFHTLKNAAPDYWSPKQPEAWKMPLPAAHYLDEPQAGMRLTTGRMKFAAVEEAEAADLAREMERDRDDSRASFGAGDSADAEPAAGAGSRRRGQKRALWWMDATRVRYTPPGQIPREEAEGRVMRALADQVFDARGGHGLGLARPLLRDMDQDDVRALADFEAKYPAPFHPPFRALPQDHKDSDTALGWFMGLDFGAPRVPAGSRKASRNAQEWSLHQRLLIFASRDLALSFKDIAKAVGLKNRKRAAEAYDAAIDAVAAIANGAVTNAMRRRQAAIDDIRQSNRAARRQRGAA